MSDRKNLPLGELLIEAGFLKREQLEEALRIQRETKQRTGEVLLELNYVTERQIMKALEFQYRIPLVDLNDMQINRDVAQLISEQLARKYTLIPIKLENRVLTVAMADALDFYAVDDVKRATSYDVRTVMAVRSEIITAIDRMYSNESAELAAKDLQQESSLAASLDELALISESEVSNAPVVRLINSIIQNAIRARASDIHIEPTDTEMRIRFRVDGALQEVMRSSKSAHPAVITRIKIIGKMDIAEKRVPQDGRVSMSLDNREVDLRISVLPTVYGEKVVIRILGQTTAHYSRDDLGLTPENMKLFGQIVRNPNGIILVSGPTGSGKTTTLYTMLSEMNKVDTNIVTVEDPVEYRMEGVNQVQVNQRAGLTFANGLRSILRQDPDIIMIGEIRDAETAEIAMRASITGHLVLSTIHTNDAPSSVARLIDMGIEPYLAAASLVGVIAQRLVRRLCPHCREKAEATPDELSIMKRHEPTTIYKASGCPRCNNTGYSGRAPIHEILPISRDIKTLIEQRGTIEEIRKLGLSQGSTSLQANCVYLVLNGTTTIDELLRVTYSMDS